MIQTVIEHWKIVYLLVALTKNVDIDKCKCSGYSTGFERKGLFLTQVSELVKT